MAWGTIRKATDGDKAKLQAVYDRFSKRHNLVAENLDILHDDGTVGAGSYLLHCGYGKTIYPKEALRLRRYLRKNIKRAIGGEGISYGYVGYHAD